MTERFINSHGYRLWTIREGEGAPVLLCSGGPGCCDYLEPVARLFDENVQTLRFDARGCGRSDLAGLYTVETCLEDLEAIRQHYGFGQWIVAGHSAGADIALAYALHYPQHVLGFLCLSGGRIHNDREWHKAYEQGREAGRETVPNFAFPPNLEVNRQVNQSWKAYIQRPTLLKELAGLARPTLFLYGDQDIRPSWPVEQVANLVPNAEFILLRGAEHHLWYTHSEQMQEILRSFVSRLS